ncbi:MAG: acyl-CoA dehydrogenase, partial [Candidatus Eremiobacteraeota bacterium]|nr:acyl-CoA dehydrogenase [Candidatus Eremiobacteraeota bacterium]
ERIEVLAPHPLATVRFSNCIVGETQRIGDEGDGFKIAMTTLDVFRPTVAAAAAGFARRALEETLAHVQRRRLFGAPLAALQMTQARLASMATDIDASELLVYRAAYEKDCGKSRVTSESAMAKWFSTEAAQRVIDSAVQLFGGRGVTRGEVVERLYRQIRALRIYEGASEIQQLIIARELLRGDAK